MASTSKDKEVSLVPTEDSSNAEMKTQHADEMPEDWDLAFVLEKLRHTECSLLLGITFDSNTLFHVAASLGHDQIVEAILSIEQHQELLTAKNSSGDIPLHVAANAGHLSIVQHLVNPYRPYSELLMARNSNGDLPLHVAANAGHLSIVQHLVESSYQCRELLTKGYRRSEKTGPACVAYETSKPFTMKNKEGNTPLHLAMIKKYEEVDLNLKAKYHEMAKFLIEKSPDALQCYNKEKNVPIDLAIKAQDKELGKLISYLCFRGGGTDLWSDAEMKRAHINSIITESVIFPHRPRNKVTSMDRKLYEAVKSKDIDSIRTIDQDREHNHPSLSDKTPELNTILHLAAASSDDDHEFVQEILEIQLFQEFVTEKNSNGDLPLHVAASAGNKKIVELLVERSNGQLQDHSPQWETNMEGNTPLHLALIKKFQAGRNLPLKAKSNEVVRFLVNNDPKVSSYPNKERKSPLYMAAEAGDAELVKLMTMAYGKSIVHKAHYYLMTIAYLPYGQSIVHTAIYGSFTATKKDILDTVLESLPNDILAVEDKEGMTPLTYAASIGYLRGVESLLRKTTIPCVYGEHTRYYPIHIATWKGHIKVVEKFLQEYPDMIELLTDAGQNILHLAAMNGKAKLVAYMLKSHDLKVEMLINNEDQNGNTPLHLAAMKRHPKVVSILTWDKRVDLEALNKEGKRALDIALDFSGENPSFRERLTWEALRYVSSPRAPRRVSGENRQCSKDGKTLSTDKYKDRTETLLLVATLVATVTFAAAFTMPGGYKESGGMAKFLEKPMFHVFVISNSIAMYSAITAVVALIWARLDDLNLSIAAYKFSVPFLGLAITMVSLAFMAGNYLVLRDLNWLAYLVLSIGSSFLFVLSIIFFPLCSPISSPHRIVRDILRYPFYLLIKFIGCDTDDGEE